MRSVWALLFVGLATLVSGCVTTGSGIDAQKTQLQIREFQTRAFETNDYKMVMKAVLNVLQDDGYIVKNANVDLGLLTADKQVDVENKGQAFWATFWLGVNARWNKAQTIECSANISAYGQQTRVRLNFQAKILDNKGGIAEVRQIDDEKFYQDFFSKVDKGVFLQKQKI